MGKTATAEAMELVERIRVEALGLGWSEGSLADLARALEDGEKPGKVTADYIEIVGGSCEQLFPNYDKWLDDEADVFDRLDT